MANSTQHFLRSIGPAVRGQVSPRALLLRGPEEAPLICLDTECHRMQAEQVLPPHLDTWRSPCGGGGTHTGDPPQVYGDSDLN